MLLSISINLLQDFFKDTYLSIKDNIFINVFNQ